MSSALAVVGKPLLDLRDAPREVKQLVLAGRCMAFELQKAGIRPDLVAAWDHCAEAVSGKVFYDEG